MNGRGLLQGQYWAKSRKKCVRREREGDIQRDCLRRSHHYDVRVGSEWRNARRQIHKSVIIKDSRKKCFPVHTWCELIHMLFNRELFVADLPYFSASHMNTSLEPEVVLLTWRSGDPKWPRKSSNCRKATRDKSRNFFWSLRECWHWHQDIFETKWCESMSPVCCCKPCPVLMSVSV